MTKKCGVCGETVATDVIECPKCGRGVFESEKRHGNSEDSVRNASRTAESHTVGSGKRLSFWKSLFRGKHPKKLFPRKGKDAGGASNADPTAMAKVGAAVTDAIVRHATARDGSGNPPCDVCSRGVTADTGFLLSTSQVVATEAYWSYLFTHSYSHLHKEDPVGNNLAMVLIMVSNSATPWRICQSCIGLFPVDRDLARKCSMQGGDPPGCGPANPDIATMPAAYAWAKLYKVWAQSIQIGGTPPNTLDEEKGTKCDFCSRIITHPKEAVALMCAEMLDDFEAKAQINRIGPARHTGDVCRKRAISMALIDNELIKRLEANAQLKRVGPARRAMPDDLWIACSKCLDRFR